LQIYNDIERICGETAGRIESSGCLDRTEADRRDPPDDRLLLLSRN